MTLTVSNIHFDSTSNSVIYTNATSLNFKYGPTTASMNTDVITISGSDLVLNNSPFTGRRYNGSNGDSMPVYSLTTMSSVADNPPVNSLLANSVAPILPLYSPIYKKIGIISDDDLLITPWQVDSGTTANNLQKVTYGNNRFVAVGQDGVVIYKNYAEGDTSWTLANANITSNLFAVAYGNGVFVAGGINSRIRYSTDAVTWSNSDLSLSGYQINDIVYGNNIFVAVGTHSSSGNGIVQTSTNGATWTNITPTNFTGFDEPLNSIAFNKSSGIYVTVSSAPGGPKTSQIYYSNNAANGSFWYIATPPVGGSGNSLFSVTCDSTRFIAVGDNGYTLRSGSSNGSTWVVMTNFTTANLISVVAYRQNYFLTIENVAGRNDNTYVSHDAGVTWYNKNFTNSTPGNTTSFNLRDFAVSDRGFIVAVGNDGVQSIGTTYDPTSQFYIPGHYYRGNSPDNPYLATYLRYR